MVTLYAYFVHVLKAKVTILIILLYKGFFFIEGINVCMEMCRLMQMVILTLKICAREIVQQNNNNLEGDGTFFWVEVIMSRAIIF